MTEQETRKWVADAYRRFTAGNADALLEKCADDVEWITPELEGIPFSGTFHGKQAVGNYFTQLEGALQTTRFEVREIIAQQDRAAVIGLLVGDVSTTGKTLEMEWAHILSFGQDGKLTRYQQFFDTAAMKAAFMPIEVEKSILKASQSLH